MIGKWLCNLFTMLHFLPHLSSWEGGMEKRKEGINVNEVAFDVAFGATKVHN